MKRFAKLVRGTTYYLGDKLFKKDGPALEITDTEYGHLTDEEGEAAGFDKIDVEGEQELRSKFLFTESAEAAAAAVPASEKPVRTRARKPDNS